MNILLVDDEMEILSCLKESLIEEGYCVFASDNGQEGLKIFRENKVDCVITDLRMPHLNGTYLVESLKNEKPDVPVIVLSGHIESERELRELGVKKVLAKPVAISQILDGIAEVQRS